MTIKIETQISGYEVVTEKKDSDSVLSERLTEKLPPGDGTSRVPANVVQMHEKVERPERLLGSTYKLKESRRQGYFFPTIMVGKRKF